MPCLSLTRLRRRGKEKKMTEEEEDRAMAESNAAEARQVRLTVQPACAFPPCTLPCPLPPLTRAARAQASSSDRCESTSLQA